MRISDGGDFWAGSVEILVFASQNRLHVHILQFFFIKLGYILQNSSEMIGNFPAVLNFNWLFSHSTGSSVTTCRFSPIIGEELAGSLIR